MTRVCSWCKCLLEEPSGLVSATPTHGICPRCLLTVLEQLETIASDQDRLLPVATWLIVVAANDPLLLRELQQRFSSSTLVRVIGDRRIGASPPDPSIASPNDRRTLASSQEKDHGSYGFFVVHRPDGDAP